MPLHIIRNDITKLKCDAIVNAVDKVLALGYRTADLAHGAPSLSTDEITERIIENI